MATHTLMQIRYMGNRHHVPPTMVGGPEYPLVKETAGQTYPKGTLVHHDANGTIAICTVTGVRHNSKIAGIPIKAATGVTGAEVYLRAIRSTDIFYANVFHSTPASSVTAQTMLGTVRGLILNAGLWHVDLVNAVEGAGDALARVLITNFPRTSPVDGSLNTIGDTNGFVECQFLNESADLTDSVPIFLHNLQYDT
jgi:hypothetical protein